MIQYSILTSLFLSHLKLFLLKFFIQQIKARIELGIFFHGRDQLQFRRIFFSRINILGRKWLFLIIRYQLKTEIIFLFLFTTRCSYQINSFKLSSNHRFVSFYYYFAFISTESYTSESSESFVEKRKQVPCYHITTCAQNPFPIQTMGNLFQKIRKIV